MTGESAVRRAEDIGGQELSYAEVKAIASGNPAVLTLAEADAELQRLTLLKKYHLDEQYVARRSVRNLPGSIASLSERLASLTTDQETAIAHVTDPIVVGERACAREEAPGVLADDLDALPPFVHATRRVALGTYRGLRFGLVRDPHFPADVYLEGAITRQYGLLREHQGPRAILNAVERLANGYSSECARIRQDLAIAESQLRDYQARLGKPFLHDAYLTALTDLRDQLRTALAGTSPETSSALAGRIKALKAATSVEATPERVNKRRLSAEEPITARIRRRLHEATLPEPSPVSQHAHS